MEIKERTPNPIPEKLIDEIRIYLEQESYHSKGALEWYSVEEVIRRILSAAVKGEVELPGEKWRGRLEFGATCQVDSLVVTRGHLAIKDGDVWEVVAYRLDRLALCKKRDVDLASVETRCLDCGHEFVGQYPFTEEDLDWASMRWKKGKDPTTNQRVRCPDCVSYNTKAISNVAIF